jgi:hypothetical protein
MTISSFAEYSLVLPSLAWCIAGNHGSSELQSSEGSPNRNRRIYSWEYLYLPQFILDAAL